MRGFGAALALAFDAALAMGLSGSLSSALLSVPLLSLFSPSSSRGALLTGEPVGNVAQQKVEVVAAPVVKDHGDGLGRLVRDVAGVAQRPEMPGAVAVVELPAEWRTCAPAPPAGSC